MKYLAAVILLIGIVVVASRSGRTETQVSKYTAAPCAEHGIADSLCTRCHPELAAMFKKNGDWCPEHRMPESQDDLCDPKLAKKSIALAASATEATDGTDSQVSSDWCAEHRVPESECTKCKPALAVEFKAKGDWCKTHGVPESHCYQCNPNLSFPQDPKNPLKKSADEVPSAVDWCAEHRVPESQCTKCNPELAATFKADGDWCKPHGVPESHCYQCNPDLSFAQDPKNGVKKPEADAPAAVDWCAEHRVPESQCTKCNPELAAKFKADGDWCKGHGVPESHCYPCNPDLKFPQEAEYLKGKTKGQEESGITPTGHLETALYRTNAVSCATDQAVIQLTSVETAQRAGLQIEEVQAASLSETIDAPAEVEFDATSSYAVTSLVGGTLVKWLVPPGQHVRQGQTLAYLQSIEGASLKAEFSHAQAVLDLTKSAYDRAQALSKDGMNSAREVQEAEANYLRAQADFRKAAGALRALGMSDSDLRNLANDDGSSAQIPLRAGQSGILVDQRVALGAVLAPGESIGLISETEKLWVEAQIRDRDLARVKTGQAVVISSDGQGLNRCQGTVSWVAAEVDPVTRMGKVRIETRPNGNALKVHQFVRVQISMGAPEETMLVPVDAVQWEGCCNVVFVSETRDRFRPRRVTVEFSNGQGYAVSGLKLGEKIVTHGSYMLKTELMKGSIGAGCCGVGA